jgi:hypothetical protein
MNCSLKLLAIAAAVAVAPYSLANTGAKKCSHPKNDCSANVSVKKATAAAPCQAVIGVGHIRVARGVRTRHVWKIVSAPKDKGQYEWDLANGIEIIQDKDHQVLNKGITKDGHFWILNANNVPGSEIEYIAHVRQIVDRAHTQMCDSVDPRIVNSL